MSQNSGNTLAALLAQAEQLQKRAEAHSEPGSIGGETEHPIKKVEDNSEDAQEGSRSSENTTDVKETQGQMSAETATKPAGEQEANQESIGPLDSKSTGKDPSTETSSVKGDKEDDSIGGKTEHPATTADGEKFGSADFGTLEKLASKIETLGKGILAELIKEATADQPAKQAAASNGKPTEGQPANAQKTAADEASQAAQAGYDLAGVFANDSRLTPSDKLACDQAVVGRIKSAVDRGTGKAEAAIKYLQGFFAPKQADDNEGKPPAEEKSEPSEGESEESAEGGEGGPPPGIGGEGGPASGDGGGGPPLGDAGMPDEGALLAMLAGGGGGGGGAPPPGGGGGGDPMAGGMPGAGGGGGAEGGLAALLGGAGGGAGGMPAPGGDPMAGGMPGGAMGGAGAGAGGAPGGDQALLLQIMQELGIDPAALAPKAAAQLQRRKQAQAAAKLNPQLARRKAAMTKMVQDLVRS